MNDGDVRKLEKAVKDNPGAGRIVIMRETGLPEKAVRKYLEKHKRGHVVQSGIARKKTIADFRATYDKSTIVPAKIKAGIKALTKHGWEYEVQFAKEIGVSLADLANFRELFTDYFILLREGRRVWVGSVETAKQMKEMI